MAAVVEVKSEPLSILRFKTIELVSQDQTPNVISSDPKELAEQHQACQDTQHGGLWMTYH
jgi:hypothetical protein